MTLPARRDLQPLLREERKPERTIAGLSRSPLPPAAVRGEITALDVPRIVMAGSVDRGLVTVRNIGEHAWPGFDPWRDGLVGVDYRWYAADGSAVPGSLFTRLAHDLTPGESMRLPFAIMAPLVPGPYDVVVTLRQDGGPWFDEAGVQARVRIDVRPWPARPRR